MRALLLFHLQGGVRMGLRASAAIVAAIVGWAIFQESPAAFVASLARAAFDRRLAAVDIAPMATLAFLLPAWASGRLRPGLNGWLRHLPFTGLDNRRALAFALVAVQLPLFVMLACGAVVAHEQGAPIAVAAGRWVLVLAAGAVANLPVEHRPLVIAIAVPAAGVALLGPPWCLPISAALLVGVDAVAGPIRTTRASRVGQTIGALLPWRIAWRALGGRVAGAYGLGVLPIVAGLLFLRNNGVGGVAAEGAIRFAGGAASVLCLFSLAKALAVRRPAWPFVRSLPWSATQRVAQDGLVLGGCALPLLLPLASQSVTAALASAALVPFLSCRAAGYVRRIQDAPGYALAFLWEGLMAVGILTLLPWSAFAWLFASSMALLRAAELERRHKVTRSSEWQYPGRPGDTSAASG